MAYKNVDWSDFNKFEEADMLYLPASGEGETMASQIVTATAKLVYKWFNDGDVFDNTNGLAGWCNDLSSYANWLWNNCREAREVLDRWWFRNEHQIDEFDYVQMLYELCEATNDVGLLKEKYEVPAVDTIYDCSGPFEFVEP